MTSRRSPSLDCPSATTTGAQAAPQPVDTAAAGEPKDAARKGVVTALRSKQFRSGQGRHDTEDPTPDQAGIGIYAPPVYSHHDDGARWSQLHGGTPTAAYSCGCGQTGTATGPRTVAALVSEYAAHKSACAGAPTTTQERRAAA